jgi:hypothetical protein
MLWLCMAVDVAAREDDGVHLMLGYIDAQARVGCAVHDTAECQ